LALTHLEEDSVDQDQRAKTKSTEEQKQKVKPATERDGETVELAVEELEERIAPMKAY
jgi:adenine-specific DNA methylase